MLLVLLKVDEAVNAATAVAGVMRECCWLQGCDNYDGLTTISFTRVGTNKTIYLEEES